MWNTIDGGIPHQKIRDDFMERNSIVTNNGHGPSQFPKCNILYNTTEFGFSFFYFIKTWGAINGEF